MLVEATSGIIDESGMDGVKVLATGEGDHVKGGLVHGDATVFEAPQAPAPLVLVAKGVLTFILIKVLMEGRSDGVNEGDMVNLIRL
jgi:hypothetical protein